MQGRVPCKPQPCGSLRCCWSVPAAALLAPLGSLPWVGCGGQRDGSQGPCLPPRPELLLQASHRHPMETHKPEFLGW